MSECNLALVVSELLNGKTIIFPTETSYGLGCDATNQKAVDKIYEIKGRPENKPLLVVVGSKDEAKKYLHWTPMLEKISDKYWPGALTVVSDAVPSALAKGVVSKDNTVAVRVTANPLLISITEKLGKPLVATSANISGAGDMYSSEAAIEMFKGNENKPDIILNQGELPKNKPSTVVRVYHDKFQILREGEVKIEL